METALIILTYNAEKTIDQLLHSLACQTCKPQYTLVIDSSSTDSTVDIVNRHGIQLHIIPKSAFNHGGTRKLATTLVNADVYIFMTQDTLLCDQHAIQNLLNIFGNHKIGCAYGRQLPCKDASVLATHARLFNYPPTSRIKKYADQKQLGIKTCFISNSFAAYRKSALDAIGSFPDKVILGEDMYVAAKMLLQDWEVAYCADVLVLHSHNYSVIEEFKRYFDIGVFHRDNMWILQAFSAPNKEGWSYLKSELIFCWRNRCYLTMLRSLLVTAAKLCGYKLGRSYKILPKFLVKKFSMLRDYWE